MLNVRREIADPTMEDQQEGCRTLEELQTTEKRRRWVSPGQAPAGRRGAPAGAAVVAAAAVGVS